MLNSVIKIASTTGINKCGGKRHLTFGKHTKLVAGTRQAVKRNLWGGTYPLWAAARMNPGEKAESVHL